MLLLNLIPNKSFPNILTIRLIGVKKIKYTKAIIIGDIIDPNISPNLIQVLFKGVKSFELIRPRNKKMIETVVKKKFKLWLFFNGQRPNIRKTIKNSKPKLLLELLDFIIKTSLNLFGVSCLLF